MNSKDKKILVTGHKGLVGSSVVRYLKLTGCKNIFTIDKKYCDFTNQSQVNKLFNKNDFDVVIMCAARVGGIQYNIDYPANMIYENSIITLNTLECCKTHRIKNVLFLGSSCIYPKNCLQPIKEEYLLTGQFEETNEPYAISKSMGIRAVQSYNRQYGFQWKALQPCNLFGENDNFDLLNSHFIPGIIRKTHDAKFSNNDLVLWGTGRSRREILHVDDLASAVELLLRTETEYEIINVGRGVDYTIREYYKIIKGIVGYEGEVFWNALKPDGVYQKLLDNSKIKELGWNPVISISEGIEKTYKNFKNGYF